MQFIFMFFTLEIRQRGCLFEQTCKHSEQYASTHKDKRVRKENMYVQKGNDGVQKANKTVQSGMSVANTAKSKLNKALDVDSNNAGVFV